MQGLNRWLALAMLFFTPMVFAQVQGAPDKIGIGVFTFTSGPAAAYGMPGYNGARVIIDQINDNGGIDGVPIKPTFVDEAQGTQGVISDFRRIADDDDNQAMIAALSSSNCLSLAPVADELHEPMITWNCDTYQLFANDTYQYVYRANSNVIPEFMAYVLYFAQTHPDARRIAIIGPDYAFGHDASDIIKAALERFAPDTQVVTDLFPSLGSSSFLSEISRIAAARPDAIFVNLWGSDLETFIHQALPRGLFRSSQVALTLGETILESTGDKLPTGVIVGMLGDGYWLTPTARNNPKTENFVAEYHDRFGVYPEFPTFKMVNAILALKAGYEKAIADNDGKWPNAQQLTAALSGIQYKTLTGTLKIRKQDHDGLVDQVVGVTTDSDEYPFRVIGKSVRYPAKAVTPPPGADPLDWIRNLPEGFLKKLPKPGSYD